MTDRQTTDKYLSRAGEDFFSVIFSRSFLTDLWFSPKQTNLDKKYFTNNFIYARVPHAKFKFFKYKFSRYVYNAPQ